MIRRLLGALALACVLAFPMTARSQAFVAGATFTTPAGTTGYTSNQTIADSATAGSVTPMEFTVCKSASTANYASTGMVLAARIKTTDTGAAGAGVSLDLYRDKPTVYAGDHATMDTSESNWIGSFDVTLDKPFHDYQKGIAGPVQRNQATFDCAQGSQKIYGMLRATTSFTPQGAKPWTIVLEGIQY